MKRFKEFLAEAFLIEGKIDDLKAQNPGLHREIDQYAAADTSATKKFVPWLVAQHKRGNVTPDHPDLHQTIQNFDRYKNLHGIKDHSSRSFQEVRDAVMPLVGGGATKAEIAHEGREKIHDSGDVQAYHIETKEASQHFYGGGKELGGDHTSWCVSARSKDCLYGHYGDMYTIHSKGDPNSPYAIHPRDNKITSRHNDGDRDIDREISRSSIAKLKPALDLIKKHFNAKLDTRTRLMIDVKNENPEIAIPAINHPDADSEVISRAIKHPNPQVALAALRHPAVDNQTTWQAADHPHPQVALTALRHPEADKITTWHAAEHADPQVALTALNDSKADINTIQSAARHSDPQVVLAALNHPKIDSEIPGIAAKNPDQRVALAALNHPKSYYQTTWGAVKNPNPQVALAGLRDPRGNHITTHLGAEHPDPQVALAALNHPKADDITARLATTHPDQRVQALARTKLGK